MSWDIKEGKVFKDALGTELKVLSVVEGKVNYVTQYDDVVRFESIPVFQKWINKEIG